MKKRIIVIIILLAVAILAGCFILKSGSGSNGEQKVEGSVTGSDVAEAELEVGGRGVLWGLWDWIKKTFGR